MSHTLQPYPAYKESGVPWLGQVPGHWEIDRAKYLLIERNDRSPEGSERLLSVSQYTGITPRRTIGDSEEAQTRAASLAGYKIVSENDFVINIMLAWNGSLGVSQYNGIVSPAYCVYKFRNGAPWYFHHLFKTDLYKGRIKVASRGVVDSRLRLYTEDLFRIETLIPPLEEQQVIVHFIQYMDSRINRYIRNKRRVIALLNEQKQAIIQRAVTRGLDPAAPLKPSGVEWLGYIPVGWDIKKIKEVSKVLRGRFSHRPRNDPSLYDGEYPFIQTGDIARAKKYISSYKQTLNEKGFAVSKSFPKGTLVMNIAANVGDIAVLDLAVSNLKCNTL